MSNESTGERVRAETQGAREAAPQPVTDRRAAQQVERERQAAKPAAAPAPTAPRPVAPDPARDAGGQAVAQAPPAAAGPSADLAQWAQLQAQFVDDPAGAVRAASKLVEDAVQALLRGSDGGGDTEELRSAFVRFRDLHRTLTNNPGG